MKVEVLGPGCPKCRKTESLLRETAAELGVQLDLQHVTDVSEISRRGVFLTPAVIINGDTVLEGRVPSADEVRGWLGS